jgi:hypothetical protein
VDKCLEEMARLRILFRDFKTLKELFEARFVKGLRRKELFETRA